MVFQCADCVTQNREPHVYPLIHPNGEIVDHFNISELPNASDQTEIKRAFGDYDNRDTMKEIAKQSAAQRVEQYKQVVKSITVPTEVKVQDNIAPKPVLVKEGDANYKFSKKEEEAKAQVKETMDSPHGVLDRYERFAVSQDTKKEEVVKEMQEERARRTTESNKKFEEEDL